MVDTMGCKRLTEAVLRFSRPQVPTGVDCECRTVVWQLHVAPQKHPTVPQRGPRACRAVAHRGDSGNHERAADAERA